MNNNDNRNISKSMYESIKNVLKNKFVQVLGMIFGISFIFILPPIILGELHGGIQRHTISSDDGYKVIYSFDFLPSFFDIFKDSSNFVTLILPWTAFIGILVIVVATISSSSYVKYKNAKKESWEIDQQKIKMENVEREKDRRFKQGENQKDRNLREKLFKDYLNSRRDQE